VVDINTDQCKECDKGTYFDSGSCSSKRILFQIEIIFKVCSSSISNCEACTSPSTCIECADPYVIDISNDQCKECDKGTYFDSGNCLSKRRVFLNQN